MKESKQVFAKKSAIKGMQTIKTQALMRIAMRNPPEYILYREITRQYIYTSERMGLPV